MATDYPDNALIENLSFNLREFPGVACAAGLLWGTKSDYPDADVKQVFLIAPYDLIIAADVVFNHSEHGKLFKSIKELLSPDGICLFPFTHYRPKHASKDMVFKKIIIYLIL